MNKIYKTAIIGGGASGLLCAVELTTGENAVFGDQIVVLEKNDRVGKKLIATGNGQGNLSNEDLSLSHYHGNLNFISEFFNSNTVNIKNYFESLGIYLSASDDGKIYPVSRQASFVLDILRAYLEQKKCTISTGVCATDIRKENGLFIIKTNNGDISAETIAMCTGGKSARQFGTDGTSYGLCKNFGHKITELFPSLVQIKTDTAKIKGLKGIKEKVNLTLLDGAREVKTYSGDLLFTDCGVSGDTAFKISAYLHGLKNPVLKVEFLTDIKNDELKEIIKGKLKLPFIKREEVLFGLLNKRVGQAVYKCSDGMVDGLSNAVKEFTLKVTGTLGFDYSQVTHGGIETSGICPESMESKLTDGLFFAGETIDVDGDCGGYNLTFAFLSGIKAGKNIKLRYN